MITSPLLAATAKKEEDIPNFPLLATPKIDGVRALIVNRQLVSRSFKLIPNKKIRSRLEYLLPEGADGEIYCGDLYSTTSTAMSLHGTGEFKFYWFDWAYDLNEPYIKRVTGIKNYYKNDDVIVPLIPCIVNNMSELYKYEKQVLDEGFEGLVLRIPNGVYKLGRSTIAEGIMVKLKRHTDSEATIVGTEELVRKGQAGNTLGSIIAKSYDGTIFKIGTGYTEDDRLALWVNRDIIIGKAVKYKHELGINKPRCPVFMEIRHEDDM